MGRASRICALFSPQISPPTLILITLPRPPTSGESADVICVGLQEMEMGTGSVAMDAAKNMLFRDGLVGVGG